MPASPTGIRCAVKMLIGTRFAETSQIHLVKFPGGARTQLTFFKDRAGGANLSAGQGDYFVFSKASGGNDNIKNTATILNPARLHC